MVWKLTAVTVRAEDPDPASITCVVGPNCSNSSLKGTNVLFWPLWALNPHGTHTYSCTCKRKRRDSFELKASPQYWQLPVREERAMFHELNWCSSQSRSREAQSTRKSTFRHQPAS